MIVLAPFVDHAVRRENHDSSADGGTDFPSIGIKASFIDRHSSLRQRKLLSGWSECL
jgi:hypothetical protein